jgi:hypothetical protein
MLSQAWTDVMALTALRQGEDSHQWRQQLKVAEKLMRSRSGPREAGAGVRTANCSATSRRAWPRSAIRRATSAAIARRLLNPECPRGRRFRSSRTELTLRLKAQARLGEDLQAKKPSASRSPPPSRRRWSAWRSCPSGTVFEFTGPDGEKAKRRLAWFSTATGATLFVNHRGQKFTDLTLEALARQVTKGHAIIVEEQKGSVIDRAWENVLNALRSFAVPEEGAPAR